jgi:hypothetical protein
LKNKYKAFIIKQLACFEQPREVIAQLKKNFGVEISQSQIAYYNPKNKQAGRELSQKWRFLFQATRDQFIEGAIQIPIANKYYRLRELQKNYEKATHREDYMEARKVLEQAAKETGGIYQTRAMNADVQNKRNSHENFLQRINLKIEEANKAKKEKE